MQANVPMTLETERRKENRKRPPSLVYVELASANGGMMRDICEEGFAVRAMMPLRIGDSTPFAFSVDASTRFEGSCQVLWVEEGGRVAGLKFTQVSPQLLEQVRVWLSGEEPPPAHQPAPPIVPTRQVSTLEELRDELRGVIPRVEIPRAEPSSIEVPHTEISQVEVPRVEIPRMEIPRVDLPHAEEPVHSAPDEEVSLSEERIVPSISPEHEHPSTPRLPEQEREVQPDRFTSAEPVSSPLTELTPEPPAFEPLPELREELGVVKIPESAARLDGATVSLAIRILVFLALVAGAVVFHRELGNGLIWLGAKLSGTQTTSSQQGPMNAAPAQTAPAYTPPPISSPADTTQNPPQGASQKEVNPTSSTTEIKKPSDTTVAAGNSPNAASKSKTPSAPASVPATNKPSGQKATGEPNSEAGQPEYLQAQEILKGKDREGGLPEAVRLLWIAVEKGNSAAEVSLADLYRRGEGVTRNCDQTRILLTAASRKGNAEAQRRLEEFLREGCE